MTAELKFKRIDTPESQWSETSRYQVTRDGEVIGTVRCIERLGTRRWEVVGQPDWFYSREEAAKSIQ